MQIDTHCHIDMFEDPVGMARSYEEAGIACVLATMLPTHYQASLPHLNPFPAVIPALGMHPMRAVEGQREIDLFCDLSKSAEYVGEIGLDLSREGKSSRGAQVENLRKILPTIRDGKFVTVHSRNAHTELEELLSDYSVGPVCFHYFIGGRRHAARLADKGHFFSLNHRMLVNRHCSILEVVPRDRILVESDGPFLTKQPLKTIRDTYSGLSVAWGVPVSEAISQIEKNFRACRTRANF